MARKLFDTIKAGTPAPAAQAAESDQPRIRSARALRGGLLELSANSVRDISPELILADGPQDRLLLEEAGIRELADSMRDHGQHVPILVRPADEPDRYRVVYGRRRLAAARLLGQPVKALVRSLDDKSSVVVQGQENALRLNPSFIEKAVFVGALRQSGYESGTIQEALAINRQTISAMTIVQEAIPMPVIEAIGPAHDIGRRRWMELADLVRNGQTDLTQVLAVVAEDLAKEQISEARFDILAKAALKSNTPPAPRVTQKRAASVVAKDGVKIGQVKTTNGDLQLTLLAKSSPDFVAWAEENAHSLMLALYDQWQAGT